MKNAKVEEWHVDMAVAFLSEYEPSNLELAQLLADFESTVAAQARWEALEEAAQICGRLSVGRIYAQKIRSIAVEAEKQG